MNDYGVIEMKKVFLDKLPTGGLNRGNRINWFESVGYKVKFIYDDIQGEIQIVKYKRRILTIKYNNKEFEISTTGFSKCQFGKILGKMTSEFRIEIGTVLKDDKRDITITDIKRIQSKNGQWLKCYKYKCNKCGFDSGKHWSIKDKEYKDEYLVLESTLLSGCSCACCVAQSKIVVKNINSIYKTYTWMIPYIGQECAKTHTYNSVDRVEVTCPDCGRTKSKKLSIYGIHSQHSIGCTCGDGYSYGHKYIFNLLTQLNQKFIDNYTFDWCKFYSPYKKKETDGEYDFIIEDKKIIIEVDGGFHRKDNTKSGQKKEESIWLDNIKDKLAKEHNYKIIRIIYNDDNFNIKQNILHNELFKKLFDTLNINWNQCEEFALKNRVKEVCEFKDNNINLTTQDIAKTMNMNVTTINKYLKTGTELGWCKYDPKEEMRKSNSRNGKLKAKNLFCINIEQVFESASEIERQSEKLFDIKLDHRAISSICLGKQRTHKGYIFKYIKDLTPEEYIKYDIKNKLIELHNKELVQAC